VTLFTVTLHGGTTYAFGVHDATTRQTVLLAPRHTCTAQRRTPSAGTTTRRHDATTQTRSTQRY
jgi:hypothetical protein